MSILNDFNILAKIDNNKTIVTPNEFIFKLKEANAISSIDYDKLKNILNDKNVIGPSKEWIDQEKDKQFQNLFKTLWPNIYSSINPPAPKPINELIAELEQKRVISELIAKQDLERHKASLNHDSLSSNYSNVYASKYNDTLNICINGLSTSSPKIEIKTNQPIAPPQEPRKSESSYPNLGSSYDFTYKTSKYLDKIVNSPYNPEDLTKETELLKSIQESQEKLKFSQKLEKTNDLVDDIIDKVKVLQNEMKKKSASFKLMNDLEALKKEHEDAERKKELMSLLEKELDRKKYCHLNPHHNHHHHHHHHRKETVDSDSDLEFDVTYRPRSTSLKNSKVSFSLPTTSSQIRRKKSVERLNRSKLNVKPKVDCWNCNCSHDTNIY
ncbi:unnamed protein product [Brachionus calyciflorus]|uniref:Uncharacterized protein n=1 Tax=Brachionus calyciflorus TaxID=104777 RepID=A0A814LGK1_9BILA|nr:unnamed protein product [Brachionus calyciflorus]